MAFDAPWRMCGVQHRVLFILLLLGTTLGFVAAGLAPTTGDAARNSRKDIGSEVVGGQAVPDGTYPFVAAVGRASAEGSLKKPFCGGSLIGPSSVLTAAHCVVGVEASSLAVVVGQTEFGSTQGEARTVTAIMVHPGFRLRSLVNDVAVLRLNAPVLSVAPIALIGAGDASFDPAGTPLTLVGWGDEARRARKVHFPQRLQERQITVLTDVHCDKTWRRFGIKVVDRTRMVCTSGGSFGAGDSGGPLFSLARGTPVQVGLVSAGSGGGGTRLPDVGPQLSEPGIAAFIASVNA